MRVGYTSQQSEEIDRLRESIEEYCRQQGIDPSAYTRYLDGTSALIDPSLLNDPAFQNYWKLAFLRLAEILYPETAQALSGEIGDGNFDALYAGLNEDQRDFIEKLIIDDPELLAYAAERSGQSPQEVTNLINEMYQQEQETGSPSAPQNDEMRRLVESLGLNMSDWGPILDSQEGMEASEQSILAELAMLDQQVAEITEALRSGTLSESDAEAAKAEMGNISSKRQALMIMINQLESKQNTILQLLQSILKEINELNRSITNNLR